MSYESGRKHDLAVEGELRRDADARVQEIVYHALARELGPSRSLGARSLLAGLLFVGAVEICWIPRGVQG